MLEKKYFFNKFKLNLPDDYDKKDFKKLKKFLKN